MKLLVIVGREEEALDIIRGFGEEHDLIVNNPADGLEALRQILADEGAELPDGVILWLGEEAGCRERNDYQQIRELCASHHIPVADRSLIDDDNWRLAAHEIREEWDFRSRLARAALGNRTPTKAEMFRAAQALALCPEDAAQILNARYWAGDSSAAQVAQDLGITTYKVTGALRTLRARMRQLVA